MTKKDEALQMALDALEYSKSYLDELADVHGTSKKAKPGSTSWNVNRAIIACREALAQKDEQEPIGEAHAYDSATRYTHCIWDADVVPVGTKLYTALHGCQPLTDDKLRAMWANYAPIVGGVLEFARAIEAAHGIGVEHEPR